ncbi:MAG: YdeI/OmpD-associated family protein [Alphaproteobacteria bacterium]
MIAASQFTMRERDDGSAHFLVWRGKACDNPAMALTDLARIAPATRAEWRDWLVAHHRQSESVWLVITKKAAGGQLSYDDVVDEALCFGWIDSLPRKLDETRSMLLLSPRKAKSAWSAVNKRRVEALEAKGLMHPAGRALIDAAKREGTWSLLDEVEALTLPEALRQAFAADRRAAFYFEAFPHSSKRGILEWIAQAKTEATRAKRIEKTVTLARDNIKANFPAGRNAGPKPKTLPPEK